MQVTAQKSSNNNLTALVQNQKSKEQSMRENMRLYIREQLLSGITSTSLDELLCSLVHAEVITQSVSLAFE